MDRFPSDDEWLKALGRAVLNFAIAEAAVVTILSMVDTNYWHSALKMTAGSVSRDFAKLVEAKGDNWPPIVRENSDRFAVAVAQRNDLLHAVPAALEDEALHLVRVTNQKFIVWSTATITDAATGFQDLAIDLHTIGRLVQPSLESDKSP